MRFIFSDFQCFFFLPAEQEQEKKQRQSLPLYDMKLDAGHFSCLFFSCLTICSAIVVVAEEEGEK